MFIDVVQANVVNIAITCNYVQEHVNACQYDIDIQYIISIQFYVRVRVLLNILTISLSLSVSLCLSLSLYGCTVFHEHHT